MKKLIYSLLAVATLLTIYAASNIEWTFHGQPISSVTALGERLQFGLRDDGVVVWRKITSKTNSPAELHTITVDTLTVTNWGFIPQGWQTNWGTIELPLFDLKNN